MSAPDLNLGRRTETLSQNNSLEGLLQQCRGVLEESQRQVDAMNHTQVRSQLQQFLRDNPTLAPNNQERLLNDNRGAREFLIVGLAQSRLRPLRQQIMSSIDAEVQRAPANTRFQVMQRRFQTILNSRTIDLNLVTQVFQRLLTEETTVYREYYAQASQAQLITQGKDLIESGQPNPPALANQSLPQEVVFHVFRSNVQFQDSFQQLRNKLATTTGGQQGFVRETYAAYRQFLTSNGFAVDNFCPSQEWYAKLCTRVNITDASLADLDVSTMLSTPDHQNLVSQVETSTQENREQERHHRSEKERLRRQAGELRSAAQTARSNGNTVQAESLENQAADLERQARDQERLEEHFHNLPRGSQAVVDLQEQALRDANAEMALFPGHPDVRHMGVFGTPFTVLSHVFNYVGRWVPEPASLYDVDTGDMMVGIGKAALFSAVLINMLKVGVGGWQATTGALGQLAKIPPSPVNAARTFVGGLRDTITASPGNLVTAVIAAGALKIGSLRDIEQFVRNRGSDLATVGRRVAGNEYVAAGLDWVSSTARPYLSRGAEGFREWIWDPSKNAAKDVMNWGSRQWESLGRLPGMTSEMVRENQQFFAAMRSLKSHLDTNSAAQQRLRGLNLTTGTLGVSTTSLARMVQNYARDNEAAAANQRPIPLSLTALAEAGFLYRNNVRINKQELEADDRYKALAQGDRSINISDIADRLIAQRNFSGQLTV